MLHPLWPVYRAAAQRMPVAAVRPALHRVTRGGPLVGKTLVVETLEAGAQTFQYVLELVGVVAFSISGAMAGIRHIGICLVCHFWGRLAKWTSCS